MRLVRLTPLVLACAAPVLPQNTSAVFASTDRPKAPALIGGRYRSPVYIREGLYKPLMRENIPVT